MARTKAIEVGSDLWSILGERAGALGLTTSSYARAVLIGAMRFGQGDDLAMKALNAGLVPSVKSAYRTTGVAWESEPDPKYRSTKRYRYQGWMLEKVGPEMVAHGPKRGYWTLAGPDGFSKAWPQDATAPNVRHEAALLIEDYGQS